jgi:hypothetical protein
MPARPLLLTASIVSLAAWITFGFVIPVGVGMIHVLLAVSAMSFVAWWGLTR